MLRTPHVAKSVRQWYLLSAIVLIAAVARLSGIGLEPFWMDEAASWWFATRPLSELWTQVPIYEAHPPLFYTVLRGWRYFFGDSEAALRTFSAVASIAVVPLTYCIGRLTLSGRRGQWLGFCAATLITLHPMQIRYAQEARGYALLTATAAALLLGLLWLTQNPQALDALWKRGEPKVRVLGVLALIVIAAAISFWLHQTAVLLVGSMIAIAALIIVLRAERFWHALAALLVVGLLILAFWGRDIPWVLGGARMIHDSFWIPKPNAQALLVLWDSLFGSFEIAGSTPARLAVVLVCLFAAITGAVKLAEVENRPAALLFAAAAVVPVAVSFVASHLIAPIFLPRTLLWTEVPFVLLIAANILYWRQWAVRTGVIVVVSLALAVIVALRLSIPRKEDWREVASILATESTADDLIVVVTPYAEVPLLYYEVPQRSPARWLALPPSFPGLPDEKGVPTGFRLLTEVDAADLDKLRRLSARSRKVWYVIRMTTSYDQHNEIARTIASVRGHATDRVRFADLVLLREYSARTAVATR